MARRVSGWDAVRAWRFIRASKAYRAAWDRLNPTPGLPERAPFPVRLRTAGDTGALKRAKGRGKAPSSLPRWYAG